MRVNYIRDKFSHSSMVLLVDVHAHLDDKKFSDDLPAVLKRAEAGGVKFVVCNGVGPESNRVVHSLSQHHPLVKPAYGLDPTESLPLTDAEVKKELAWIQKQEFVAFGEVGLDHKWTTDSKDQEKQVRMFSRVLQLAKSMDKPIIVHSRKAERECIDMIRDSGVKRVVFHCFGGKLKLVREIRDEKWYLSIPPSIVRDEHFQRIVEEVPVKQLLTETDSPYQGPEPGMRNEPANVRFVVEKIAKIKEQTVEEIANQLFANYLRIFS